MKFETWLQTYLGLRICVYADGGETNGGPDVAPGEKGGKDIADKGLTYEDFKGLITQEQFDKLTQAQKDAMSKVLDELKKTEDLLSGVVNGKTIVGQRQAILNKVYQIGDPKDQEFAQIVAKIDGYAKELSTLDEAGKRLAEKISKLKELIQTEVKGGMDDARKKLNETIAKSLWITDLSQIKEGAELTINTSVLTPEQKQLLTLGKLIPPEILKIKIDGKEYSRAGGSKQGEFIDADSKAVVLKEGMKITIVGTRTSEQVKTLDAQMIEGLEGKELIEKTALELIRKYGLDENFVLKDVLANVGPFDEDNEQETKNFQNPDFVKKEVEKYLFEKHIGKQVSYSLEGRLAEANKITDPVERQKKIEEIMGARMEAAIKSNPTDWVGSTLPAQQEQVPELVRINNDLFKKILGFDFLKEAGIDVGGNPQEMMAAQVGGADATRLGGLSERFESGGKGPEAINPDDNGLPSFGTYQLRADMLKQFAGEMGINGDHTQKGKDSEFAKNWLKKVQEVGVEAFKAKEHAFIEKTHFKPQIELIKKTGVDADKFTMTMKNVVWSCAVQHGAGTDVITQAISALGAANIKPGDTASELKLAEKVYEIRTAKYPDQTGRYKSELQIVTLNLKNVYGGGSIDGKNIVSIDAKIIRKYNDKGKLVPMTYCSETARFNAANFGLSIPNGDAFVAKGKYGTRVSMDTSSLFSSNNKFVDLFSGSKNHPTIGHRALAVNSPNGWVVLDPYLKIVGGRSTTQPIPLATYMSFLQSSGRGFKGGVAYS